jgi:hypothetical protein
MRPRPARTSRAEGKSEGDLRGDAKGKLVPERAAAPTW